LLHAQVLSCGNTRAELQRGKCRKQERSFALDGATRRVGRYKSGVKILACAYAELGYGSVFLLKAAEPLGAWSKGVASNSPRMRGSDCGCRCCKKAISFSRTNI